MNSQNRCASSAERSKEKEGTPRPKNGQGASLFAANALPKREIDFDFRAGVDVPGARCGFSPLLRRQSAPFRKAAKGVSSASARVDVPVLLQTRPLRFGGGDRGMFGTA